MIKNVILFIKGFIIGIANAIPGVSGGTLALMLGIYEDLINGIKAFDIDLILMVFKGDFSSVKNKIPLRLFVLVGIGALTSIILLSRILSWLLDNKPVLINSFFFGLILATVPIIAKFINKWDVSKIVITIISTICTYFIVNMLPIETPETYLFIFISGVIAISSMILPGLSGSFMLIILGKYEFILNAINNRDIAVLAVFSAGLAVGIISFVRILSFLFKKFHDITIAILTGLVIGSLDKIWPWKTTIATIVKKGEVIPFKQANVLPTTINSEFWQAIALIITGILIAFLLNLSESKKINIS